MLRAGQSLPPTGLSTLRFDAGRFPPTPAACYRASWQLPRPDSHRLASTGLRVRHLPVPHLLPLPGAPRCWAHENDASLDRTSTIWTSMTGMGTRLTTTSHAILGLLSIAPMSGYDLYQAVEGSTGHFWPISKSQVYAEL